MAANMQKIKLLKLFLSIWPSAITIRRNYEPENQQTQSGTSEE